MIVAKRTWQMLASAAGACLVGYFLYHTVEGERGWVAQMHLQNEVNAAQETLTNVQKEHDALDHRVRLMRPESLDPDLLDEQSRKTLNYSKPNEIIILQPQEPNPAPPKP
ncbi:MAG: septum formation initiator family protein [Alphaproteobacteria bacterium]